MKYIFQFLSFLKKRFKLESFQFSPHLNIFIITDYFVWLSHFSQCWFAQEIIQFIWHRCSFNFLTGFKLFKKRINFRSIWEQSIQFSFQIVLRISTDFHQFHCLDDPRDRQFLFFESKVNSFAQHGPLIQYFYFLFFLPIFCNFWQCCYSFLCVMKNFRICLSIFQNLGN